MWNRDIKNNIIANHGSIQQINGIPQHIKDKYKIVWELSIENSYQLWLLIEVNIFVQVRV